jgi:hypothetical protein
VVVNCGHLELTASQDVPYLSPIIQEIEAEKTERSDLEGLVVQKRKANQNAAASH